MNSKLFRNIICAVAAACAVLCASFDFLSAAKPMKVSAATVVDDTLAETYQSKSKLTNEPTIVCDVTSRAILQSLVSVEEKPSNAILHFNEKAEIEDENGESLGSFTEIYASFEKKIIPILYIADDAAAEAAISYLAANDILDLAVMSDTPALVQKVREADDKIRGIVEWNETATLDDMVQKTNQALANVAVIPQKKATAENVRYIQGRFKTVWVRSKDDSDLSFYQCVGSGAYGIITEDFTAAYAVLNSFGKGLTRMPFNVAHRGLPEKCHENSVSGVKAAIAGGATHVELDGYLTRDKRIVLMHDETLDRTTSGSGRIEALTLSEIRQYKLTGIAEDEEIPVLEDVIEVLRDTDTVLVFEIKSYQTQIVSVLKSILDQYDFYDQTVVITFNNSTMLPEMRKLLPQIPTADLNSAMVPAFPDVLKKLGKYNTGIDTGKHLDTAFNEKMLRDRGIIGWYWTYENFIEINSAAMRGFCGLTNNVADTYKDMPLLLTGGGNLTSVPVVNEKIELNMKSYGGETMQVEGTVKAVIAQDGGYYVVAAYKNEQMTLALYSDCFFVTVTEQKSEQSSNDESGCKSSFGAPIITLLCGAFALVAVSKKRN